MKKALSLILALVMCLSLCACGGDGTPASAPITVPTTVPATTNPETVRYHVGDTVQGSICNVTVTSVEFVDKIEDGFFRNIYQPFIEKTYMDVTADEGYSILKIDYRFDYTGKAAGKIELHFAIDYDDGFIFEGHGGHALPLIENEIKYGFEEEYVFGEKTYFKVSDPLEFQSVDAFTYIFVNDAVKENVDKSYELKIDIPLTPEKNSEVETFTYNLR